MQYYYMDAQGQSLGPVEEEELRELRSNGTLQDTSYVAIVGSAEWKTLLLALFSLYFVFGRASEM